MLLILQVILVLLLLVLQQVQVAAAGIAVDGVRLHHVVVHVAHLHVDAGPGQIVEVQALVLQIGYLLNMYKFFYFYI